MSDNDFYVYCLFRPLGDPFYIGKGRRSRWDDHEKISRRENTHKSNIITRAKREGLLIPKVKLAQGLSESAAFELEMLFIKAIGREPSGPLTNKTNGGEGVSGHKHSENTLRKLSEAKLGKVSPKKGTKSSPEAVAKMVATKRGVPSPKKGSRTSEEQRAKLRQAHKGKKLSEEHKASIRASLLKNPPNKGRVFSAEVRLKVSRAQQCRPVEVKRQIAAKIRETKRLRSA